MVFVCHMSACWQQNMAVTDMNGHDWTQDTLCKLYSFAHCPLLQSTAASCVLVFDVHATKCTMCSLIGAESGYQAGSKTTQTSKHWPALVTCTRQSCASLPWTLATSSSNQMQLWTGWCMMPRRRGLQVYSSPHTCRSCNAEISDTADKCSLPCSDSNSTKPCPPPPPRGSRPAGLPIACPFRKCTTYILL